METGAEEPALISDNLDDSRLARLFDYDLLFTEDISHLIQESPNPPAYSSIESIIRETAPPPSSIHSSKQAISQEWLVKQCEAHLLLQISNGADTGMSRGDLANDILTILKSKKSDDDIQNDLVDLLGYENMDFVGALAIERKRVVDASESDLSTLPDLVGPIPNTNRPAVGSQISIHSSDEKANMKKYRKELQRRRGKFEDDSSMEKILDPIALQRAREEQLAQNAASAVSANQGQGTQQEQYPHVYSSSKGGNSLSVFGTKFVLPAGSIREEFADYEEITVPPPTIAMKQVNETTVDISSLDAYSQRAFKGYKTLNRVQSLVYPIAYETNENMLVCAPTGAVRF